MVDADPIDEAGEARAEVLIVRPVDDSRAIVAQLASIALAMPPGHDLGIAIDQQRSKRRHLVPKNTSFPAKRFAVINVRRQQRTNPLMQPGQALPTRVAQVQRIERIRYRHRRRCGTGNDFAFTRTAFVEIIPPDDVSEPIHGRRWPLPGIRPMDLSSSLGLVDTSPKFDRGSASEACTNAFDNPTASEAPSPCNLANDNDVRPCDVSFNRLELTWPGWPGLPTIAPAARFPAFGSLDSAPDCAWRAGKSFRRPPPASHRESSRNPAPN